MNKFTQQKIKEFKELLKEIDDCVWLAEKPSIWTRLFGQKSKLDLKVELVMKYNHYGGRIQNGK